MVGKICPIISYDTRGGGTQETGCLGERCGWWSEDRCGMAHIGSLVKSLIEVLETLGG